MKKREIYISLGEVYDRHSILKLKRNSFGELGENEHQNKIIRDNLIREMSALNEIIHPFEENLQKDTLDLLIRAVELLNLCNQTLWVLENKVRKFSFYKLMYYWYITRFNDRRSQLKKEINKLTGEHGEVKNHD